MLFKLFGKRNNQTSQSPAENENTADNETSINQIVESAVRNGLADFIAQTQKESKNIGIRLQELIALESDTADMVSENIEMIKEITEDLKTGLKEQKAKNDAMRKTIIQTVDMIEDFYLFAKKEGNPDISVQAELMWANACKNLSAVGLTRIYSERALYDPLYNEIKGTVSDERYPNGTVIEVFRSGYVFAGTVLRKSEVIVNKL